MNVLIGFRRRKNKIDSKPLLIFCFSLAIALIASSGPAWGAKSIKTEVTLGKSSILTLPVPIQRISIADPSIADVVVIKPNEVQINGKTIGSTSVIIWDRAGNRTFFDLDVVMDVQDLTKKIKEIAPGDEVNLQWINTSTLVVTGSVKTDERKLKIHNLLLGFGRDITETELYVLQGGVTKEVRPAGGGEEKGFKFVMLLEVNEPPQVLLQITVASMDRNATRNLGINWAYIGKGVALASSGGSAFPITSISSLLGISGAPTSADVTFGNSPNFGVIDTHNGAAYMIKALASKGLAKILAEPNLIVKSGEEGRFHAGGEFPVPVVTSLGGTAATNTVTVQFKPFGVTLNFKPMVKENGIIQLKLDPAEVSSIDKSTAVLSSGFNIPGVKTDTVSTSVDLHEGETFVIAGLIDDEWSKNLSKFPILGDIPILGAFFREQTMTKNERELVFVVTPKLMKPMAPGQRPELPGMNEPTARQEEDLRWIPLLPTYRSMDAEQLK